MVICFELTEVQVNWVMLYLALVFEIASEKDDPELCMIGHDLTFFEAL